MRLFLFHYINLLSVYFLHFSEIFLFLVVENLPHYTQMSSVHLTSNADMTRDESVRLEHTYLGFLQRMGILISLNVAKLISLPCSRKTCKKYISVFAHLGIWKVR